MNDGLILVLSLAMAALAALAVALGALWFAMRDARARLDALHGMMARLLEAQAPLDAQLRALASLVRDERALAPPPAAAGRAYELAAHLASSGVGTAQLVAQCGLTPAEAELTVRIHGLRAGTRAA